MILASFVFQKEYFIRGKSSKEQLRLITEVFGTADLEAYAVKYGIDLSSLIL